MSITFFAIAWIIFASSCGKTNTPNFREASERAQHTGATTSDLTTSGAGPTEVDGSCVIPAAPEVMPGINYYTNPTGRGDEVDEKKKQDNQDLLIPLYNLVLSSTKGLDGTPSWSTITTRSQECTRQILEDWASKRALVKRPYHSGGLVNRAFYIVGLNTLVLKTANAGVKLSDEVYAWLFTLTTEVLRDYGAKGFHFHGYHNNVNAFAGAATALFLALVKDKWDSKYQPLISEEEILWLDSLRGINHSGSLQGHIPAELARGQLAMNYSLSYFSALTIQLRARSAARGYVPTTYANQQIEKFKTAFGSDLCGSTNRIFDHVEVSPGMRENLKQSLMQYGFRVVIGFEMITPSDTEFSCLDFSQSTVDARLGGDHRKTLSILENM